MIARAIVQCSAKSEYTTIETIVCFDTCLYCGSSRERHHGGYINNMQDLPPQSIHLISCMCSGEVDHDYLDEEWMIIRMLNELDISPIVELNP